MEYFQQSKFRITIAFKIWGPAEMRDAEYNIIFKKILFKSKLTKRRSIEM